MTAFWRGWLNVWCWLVIAFGLVLVGGGLDAADSPVELLYGVLGGGAVFEWTPHLRFSVALMGAVTMGWGVTFLGTFMAAHRLGAQATPIWRLVTASVLVWFMVDGALSVATGFWLNVVPNTALLIGYLMPLLSTGVMTDRRTQSPVA